MCEIAKPNPTKEELEATVEQLENEYAVEFTSEGRAAILKQILETDADIRVLDNNSDTTPDTSVTA